MIKKKYIISFVLSCFIFLSMGITAYCDNVTLYSSIDDSSSQANLLTDIMRNDSNYDPFNDYAIVRAGERDYRIYFGSDITGDTLTCIQYIPSYQMQATQINRFTNRSLSINKNGFYYCGSVEGVPSSKLVDDYKTGIVVVVAAIVILTLFIFKIFRKSDHKKAKFYSVR